MRSNNDALKPVRNLITAIGVCAVFGVVAFAFSIGVTVGTVRLPEKYKWLTEKCTIPDEYLAILGVDNGVPRTDHGILSVMTPIHQVDNVVEYNDLLYDFMVENWPEQVEATSAFGHYMNPSLKFGTDVSTRILNETGSYQYTDHMGHMNVLIQYDDKAKEPSAQSITLFFCCDYNEDTARRIALTLDEYLGIKPDSSELSKQLSLLILGDVALEVDGVSVSLKSQKAATDEEPHIFVKAHFENKMPGR